MSPLFESCQPAKAQLAGGRDSHKTPLRALRLGGSIFFESSGTVPEAGGIAVPRPCRRIRPAVALGVAGQAVLAVEAGVGAVAVPWFFSGALLEATSR